MNDTPTNRVSSATQLNQLNLQRTKRILDTLTHRETDIVVPRSARLRSNTRTDQHGGRSLRHGSKQEVHEQEMRQIIDLEMRLDAIGRRLPRPGH